MKDFKPLNNNKKEVLEKDNLFWLSETQRKYKLVRARFDAIKMRYKSQLHTIEQTYISNVYSLKEGDVIRFTNRYIKEPTLIVIDRLYFGFHGSEEETYEKPFVCISGHQVDEDGYDYKYPLTTTHLFEYLVELKYSKIEKTDIISKGIFKQ